MSSMYTQRTGSMSLEGFWLVDSANGTRDPGQAAVETYATRVGYGAYADIRVRAMPSGYAEIGNFYATCQFALADRGGGVTDVDPWGTDILFEGRPVGSGVFSYLQ